jgi:hypothetical protein
VHFDRSHKSNSLDVEVQKLSFDFSLLYAMRMVQKNVCTVVLCFGHVGAMTMSRDHGVFVGMLGPESITGLCYTEATVLHRIWEQRQAQYKHALD